MAETVELFYDFGSPYSYLASTRIEALIERTGAVLAWRPFLLGGVFKSLGTISPAETSASKARWMLRDLEQWAAFYEVPYRMNPHFPVNTLRAMRLAVAAEERGHQVPLARRLFADMWVEGKDLADPAVLAEALKAIGAPKGLLERTDSGHVKERLKANTEEAVSRGAFGAPAIFVGEELFWGNDRLDFLERRLERGP
ncbi:MAG: 2-hydroxychromene-2-carboxylate isomerase [Deltaproteobacteria bacterium]|nr:2-hydroxychromene-2-carboxylate isomerase [Deltaproteobacteria bacterium]